MIEIIGSGNETPEGQAAEELKQVIEAYWGEQIAGDEQKITIKCDAQCHGQKVRDIDLLLLVSLKHPLEVLIPNAEQVGFEGRLLIKSLVVAIEVKDHTAKRVRDIGNATMEVKYKTERWKNATKQSDNQNVSLRNYLKFSKGIEAVPFIANVLWFRNLTDESLPDQPHNVLGANLDWPQFIRACRSKMPPLRSRDGFSTLNAQGDNFGVVTRIKRIFTESCTPTSLDRPKLTAITKEATKNLLGGEDDERQLVLRGRGGTGKTISLLSFAFEKYKEKSSRSLILTYNVALKSELERLLVLLNVRSSVDGGTIRVETVHQFLWRLMVSAEILKSDDASKFLDLFDEKKEELLEKLLDNDVKDFVIDDCDLDLFDYVCVDEAQDFPSDERDIIQKIFGFKKCIIADGIDQLVRPTKPCDWMQEKEIKKGTKIFAYKKSLRLQTNLCRFANAFAGSVGLEDWKLQENSDLPGGRVVVFVEKNPLENEKFLEEILDSHEEHKNEPIDMLFCVPPSMVGNEIAGSLSEPGAMLEQAGKKVWDGTSKSVRSQPLLENDRYRLLQYESCRGLEGWTTLLLRFDEFFAVKKQMIEKELAKARMTDMDPDLMAFQWMMIPLTRCINTLVIQLEARDSKISKTIIQLAEKFDDFIDLR